MNYAVVIVRPKGYVHSDCFRELAETLHHSLLDLGHDSILTEDYWPQDRRCIVLGSHMLQFVSPPPKDAILYQLEQVEPGAAWLTPPVREALATHEVWDYSPRNASLYPSLGLPPPRLVPVGYHPCLTHIEPASEQDIDVLFYGSLNKRRIDLLNRIQGEGLKVEVVPRTVYGAGRDRYIARAKLVLNVHFYEAKVFEMTRVSYALANLKCVVSETGLDAQMEEPFWWGVCFAPYDQIPSFCPGLVANERLRNEMAEIGFETLRKRFDMRRILREVIA